MCDVRMLAGLVMAPHHHRLQYDANPNPTTFGALPQPVQVHEHSSMHALSHVCIVLNGPQTWYMQIWHACLVSLNAQITKLYASYSMYAHH